MPIGNSSKSFSLFDFKNMHQRKKKLLNGHSNEPRINEKKQPLEMFYKKNLFLKNSPY